MTACAPSPSTARACSTVRMPPPTRQGSGGADRARPAPRCLPRPRRRRGRSAAPGDTAQNFSIQPSRSSVSSASRSPCTSWTTRPPLRSMEGISMRGTVEPHGHACPRRNCLRSEHGVFREVEDRGRQRGVGAPGGEHVDEVLEGAGAARRDDRDLHGVCDAPRSTRSRSRSACRRGRSTSAGSRRRRGPRLRAPTRPRRGLPRRARSARRPRTRRPARFASMATTTAWLP